MPENHDPSGSTSAAISDAAVRVLREYTGRGPTKVRTVMGKDMAVILMGDTLTKAERSLVESGDEPLVHEIRHRFQMTMRDDLVEIVEKCTGRTVAAFMSANHFNPDLAAEIFVLEPVPEGSTGK